MNPGDRLGRYEIRSALGAGGMGEVWRAADTQLGREVALKLLPEDFADDPERHARFEREARTLASLNHPAIATLFGLEHLDGHHVLVMELVEGEGLDARLERGPLAVDEAVTVAVQIADALEAAHEHGIVHRDLKPANVMLREDGAVKVLDFGLAKAWEGGKDDQLSLSPTVTRAHTAAGVILGTAAYMSPEQARGRTVDRRADIWAFGAVLWEMLTGRRLFGGETVSDVLANVLKHEIDWAALPGGIPPALDGLLRRCLERSPRERFRDIGDVRWELEHLADADPVVEPPRRATTLPILAGLAAGLVVAAVAVWLAWPKPAPPQRSIRAAILAPEDTVFNFHGSVGAPALSPDGRFVVFAAQQSGGTSSLWVRPLAAAEARRLPGTENASYPFWSPDSRSVAFFTPGKLRRIDIDGGAAQSVCDVANGRGGSWSQDGVIVFAPELFGSLARVAAGGGSPRPMFTELEVDGQTSQRWPFFLPDGRHFVFWAGSPLNSTDVKTDGIFLASLDEPEPTFLFPASSNALYSPAGYLLFLRQQMLMAQPFDAAALEPRGDAVSVIEGVTNPENYRLGDFSVTAGGTLVCQIGVSSLSELVVFDGEGQEIGTLIDPVAAAGLRLSPDESTLAMSISDDLSKNMDVWLVDVARDLRRRFTFAAAIEMDPVWSPDGSRIVFTASQRGRLELHVRNANGAGEVERLFETGANVYANDWSPDGAELAATLIEPGQRQAADIWIIPAAGDADPRPFLATQAWETRAAFSPDGRWLAYQSDESGTFQIYVTPYPGPGGKWQVSQDGGLQPLWRRDGRAIYFRTLDGTVMEAAVSVAGEAARFGEPKAKVEAANAVISGNGQSFVVLGGGERFLVLRPMSSDATPLTLITNWTSLLDR